MPLRSDVAEASRIVRKLKIVHQIFLPLTPGLFLVHTVIQAIGILLSQISHNANHRKPVLGYTSSIFVNKVDS